MTGVVGICPVGIFRRFLPFIYLLSDFRFLKNLIGFSIVPPFELPEFYIHLLCLSIGDVMYRFFLVLIISSGWSRLTQGRSLGSCWYRSVDILGTSLVAYKVYSWNWTWTSSVYLVSSTIRSSKVKTCWIYFRCALVVQLFWIESLSNYWSSYPHISVRKYKILLATGVVLNP